MIKGCSYYQHINDHSLAGARDIARSTPAHGVNINGKALYGHQEAQESIFVNSMHHQALVSDTSKLSILIDENNYMVSNASTSYGRPVKAKGCIIEGVDIKLHGCKLRGVQWHPEELNDVALLTTFFSENNKVIGNGKV
jgi:gamma-glutamyl-gamma-aminobutyrate hydrolase PuuD